MNKKKILYIILICSLIINLILGLKVHRMIMESIDDHIRTEVIHSTDTIKIHQPVASDTVYLTKTVTKAIEVPRERVVIKDGAVDTVIQFDTLRIEIPKEQRIYNDSLYTAWVSGVEPTLDSIQVYKRTTTITNTVTKKTKPVIALTVGGYAGYSIQQKKVDYGVGLHFGVPIWSW